MQTVATTSAPRLPLHAAASLLGALVLALVVTSGASLWLPAGLAGIDHIVVPIVAFPVVWVVFALVLYADPRRGRAWTLVGGLTAVHVLLIALHFAG